MFEKYSEPDGEGIVYAISSPKYNTKGILTSASGLYANCAYNTQSFLINHLIIHFNLTNMKRLLISNIIQPAVTGNFVYFARNANSGDFQGLMSPVKAISHFATTGDRNGTYKRSHISKISYVLDNSATYITNDAEGEKTIVAPGNLLWVMASVNNDYAEGPTIYGEVAEVLAFYLDIPASNKNYSPTTIAISKNEIPEIVSDGIKTKILCGQSRGIINPAKIPLPLTILHISILAEKEFNHILPANYSGTVYVIKGSLTLRTSHESHELDEGEVIAMAYSKYNESISFQAKNVTEIIFVSGQPEQVDFPTIKSNKAVHSF